MLWRWAGAQPGPKTAVMLSATGVSRSFPGSCSACLERRHPRGTSAGEKCEALAGCNITRGLSDPGQPVQPAQWFLFPSD